MGIPETTSRMRNAPLQALRTVFAGIGRILMTADRPERTAQMARSGNDSGNAPGLLRPGPTPPIASSQARWRSLDETGNVRLLSAEDFEDALDQRTRPTTHAAVDDSAAYDPAAYDPAAYDSASYDNAGESDPWFASGPSAADSTDVAPAPDYPAPAVAEPAVSAAPAPDYPAPAVAEPPVSAAPAPDTTPAPAALPLPAYDTLSLPSIRARLRGLDTDQLRVLLAYEQAHAERPEVLGMLERRIEKLEAGG